MLALRDESVREFRRPFGAELKEMNEFHGLRCVRCAVFATPVATIRRSFGAD